MSKNPAGRPKGSVKPDSERRVSITVRVLPIAASRIKRLPRGHLRRVLESLYGD